MSIVFHRVLPVPFTSTEISTFFSLDAERGRISACAGLPASRIPPGRELAATVSPLFVCPPGAVGTEFPPYSVSSHTQMLPQPVSSVSISRASSISS